MSDQPSNERASAGKLLPGTADTNRRFREILRDDGIKRAANHADQVVPDWTVRAGNLLATYCSRQRALGRREQTFLTEDLRDFASDQGFPEPPDRRAWGAVLVRAARAGVIRKVGYAKSTDARRHSGVATEWSVWPRT